MKITLIRVTMIVIYNIYIYIIQSVIKIIIIIIIKNYINNNNNNNKLQ